MGMDVYGRNAADVAGEYFRASVWSWRPLQELLKDLCGDLLSEDLLHGMQFNEGMGPEDPAICQEIARRIRDWLSSSDDAAYFLREMPEGGTPESLVMELLGRTGGVAVSSQEDYYIDREHIEAFANFVESSGGFAVW